MRNLAIKIAVVATAGLIVVSLTLPALAQEMSATPGSRPGLLRNFATNKGRAAIGSGALKSKSGNIAPATLVVTRDGKDYTVNVDANTQLRRRFWGKATLVEFSVNDTLNVIGLWANGSQTAINARLVRDVSIQKRFGVFVGEVDLVTGTGWAMNTVHQGSQTVTVSGTTKFVNRKGETITQADVKIGDKVRVKGMWNSQANTITEVAHTKDYSLPLKTITP